MDIYELMAKFGLGKSLAKAITEEHAAHWENEARYSAPDVAFRCRDYARKPLSAQYNADPSIKNSRGGTKATSTIC
jgi:hypothetical protein